MELSNASNYQIMAELDKRGVFYVLWDIEHVMKYALNRDLPAERITEAQAQRILDELKIRFEDGSPVAYGSILETAKDLGIVPR